MVPINLLAVLVSAVASIALGMFWYGPLFGKAWMNLVGVTPEQVAAFKTDPAAKKKMGRSYMIMALGSLVMAYVLATTLVFATSYMHNSGILAGLQAGFWLWLGFVAPVAVAPVLWDSKPWKYFFITGGYYLVSLLISGCILALWV
ncbi:MAG: hypothetical protein JWN64_437 [Parcubacteria group bacterium]|nr:hypothetical protein [Parcubacteria group bacterium]